MLEPSPHQNPREGVGVTALFRVTCTQPDGTKFISSPRTKAQAETLAANLAGKRKGKPSLCMVKDIRIERVIDCQS